MMISSNDVVLFQGDSITDVRRARETDPLGTGYAFIAASLFMSRYPEMNVSFINRGVSGNRVADLEVRWDEDCLDLEPNVLSIMIGVNDCWRRFDRNQHTSTESYRAGYERLLTRVKERSATTKIVLLEPFLIPARTEQLAWREDLDPKIHAVRELARAFGAVYVPLDGLFAEACAKQKPEYWSQDGVHPSPAGHGLIARAWLKAVTG